MNGFGEFLGAVAAGVDTLAGFDRQAAFDAGVQPKRVRDWAKVHDVYFGSTRLKRQQRVGVAKARANRVSMDTLILIEESTKLITDPLERAGASATRCWTCGAIMKPCVGARRRSCQPWSRLRRQMGSASLGHAVPSAQ